MWDQHRWLNWFCQFLCEGLFSVNLRGFYYSYAWSRSLCKGGTSFCTERICRKLCRFLLMFSTDLTALNILLPFPLSITFIVFMHGFWFKIDEVLSINLSANVFIFGDFNFHQKDSLAYSGGTDRPGELFYNFSISNNLISWVGSSCNWFIYLSL